MLRGADKLVRDNNDKIPIELTSDITEANLQLDVERMLGEPSKLECLMLQPPNRLTYKNPMTMIVYICLFIGATVV